MPAGESGQRPASSLRWRLPLMISALLAAILALLVYAAYSEVKRTLVGAAAARAQSAATQIADLLERATRPTVEQLRRVAATPALRQFVDDPTPAHRESARATL